MKSKSLSDDAETIPLVIYVHGLCGSSLRKKTENGRGFFDLPTSLIKSFLFGNNGHADIALPITWRRYHDGQEEILEQDCDDVELYDDLRKYP